MLVAANVAAIAINIVGVKQCFKEGTLVACLNENGEEVRKPIENIALGTLVLAYDEETGERAYKKVVRLFRNETKRWCTVTVEVDGKEEQIVSTPGHKYYLPNNTGNREIGLQQEHESYITLSEKWVSACKLKSGDKVLLSDGKYGIIVSVKIEELETPETTYNFEVEDFHTYFVGENPVCVHNANCSGFDPKANSSQKVKMDNGKFGYVQNSGIHSGNIVSPDTAKHGDSFYKLYKEIGGNKAKLIGDLDVYGNIMQNKHSSNLGKIYRIISRG